MSKIEKNSITVGWIDNGATEGAFTASIAQLLLGAQKYDLKINGFVRSVGSQIGRNRQKVIDLWYKSKSSEWLLFIDSDIVFTPEDVQKLLHFSDKNKRPVVSGVYFISFDREVSIMEPTPCIFNLDEKKENLKRLSEIPVDSLVKVDVTGLGFCLINRSAITKLIKISPKESFFYEYARRDGYFLGEDVTFFIKLKKTGIQAYAHTGVLLKHIKPFCVDVAYNNLWKKNEDFILNKEYAAPQNK